MKIPVHIISQQEAIKMGLTTHNNSKGGNGGNNQFLHGVVGKPGIVIGGKKQNDEIMEIFKIDIKTDKKEIIHEHPDYKILKKKLKINEHEEKK